MRGNETFAIVMHELQQVGPLPGVELDLAVSEEEDSVSSGERGTAAGGLAGCHERLVRNDIGIGADVGIPQIRFVTEPLDQR